MTKLCPGEFFIDLKYFNFSNLIYFISVLHYEGAKQKGNDTMNYESELVIRAKNGDANALNLLLDHNKSYIYAIAFALLKNHEDAEDAVQKTMITVWQSIGSLESPEAFKSWLYRIAHTRSLNVLQSKKNNQVILDDDISDMPQLENMESEMMLPQAYAERDDLRDRLYLIIDGLSAVQRETIVLYYFNDRSVAEIAEIMDCSDNTVKSRLYLARHSIKTEIEEQERKSGEKFYGIAVGALPIGYFVAEHVKHSLPPAEVLGNLVTTAQQAGQNAVSQAADGTAVSEETGSAAAKTAAKGLPTAAKVAIAAVGIAVVAIAGVMTAKLITDGQHKDEPAPIETQTETTAPTEAPTEVPTEAPTEAPTEPDYTDAYRAYFEVLENNKSDIKAYDWQLGDDESRPIAFADITGDDTPEMIVAACNTPNQSTDYAVLNIFTYDNGIKQIYSFDEARTGLQYKKNTAPGEQAYALYQRSGDKKLYMYYLNRAMAIGYSIDSFDESGGKLNSTELVEVVNNRGISDNRAEIDSVSVSEDSANQKIKELSDDSDVLLMYAKPDMHDDFSQDMEDFISKHKNQAMTYDEAIAYLKGLIGEISDDSSDKEDYSVIADTYTATFSRHYFAELTIHEDGSFESIYYFDPASGVISNRDPAEYSLCHGKIVDLTEIGSGVYTFHVADVSYDYHVGDSGNVTYYDRREKTERSMYASFIKQPIATDGEMTLYTKGTMPADMRGSHFKSYVYPDDPNTSERANTPIPYNIIYIPYGSTDHPYYGQ